VSAIGWGELALVALAAVAGAFASSLTGVGGGIVLAIALAPILGVAAVVPVLSVAMALNHATRIHVFRRDVDSKVAGLILAGAAPGALAGAYALTRLDESATALVLGLFLVAVVILRRVLGERRFILAPPVIVALAVGYGVLAGMTIGGGILVLPLLAAAGLSGARLVATDALIGLVVHALKTIVFGAAAALSFEHAVAGVVIGALMLPGTLLARRALAGMSLRSHALLIDTVILLGALSFLVKA
jgi:uncharacterized membrane protein YfcA